MVLGDFFTLGANCSLQFLPPSSPLPAGYVWLRLAPGIFVFPLLATFYVVEFYVAGAAVAGSVAGVFTSAGFATGGGGAVLSPVGDF